MDNNMKEGFTIFFSNIKNKKTFYKEIPNLLTLSRAVGVIFVNILYFTGNIIPSIILTTLMFATDFFDGKLARKFGVQSEFGADLDAICDKIMFLGLTIPALFINKILLINTFLEGVIALINLKRRKNGSNARSTMIGKIKMWPLSMTVALCYLSKLIPVLSLFNVMFIFTTAMQLITSVDYYKKYTEENKNVENNQVFNNDTNTNTYSKDYSNGLDRQNNFYVSKNKNTVKRLVRTKNKPNIR